jgi:hypothetical protein
MTDENDDYHRGYTQGHVHGYNEGYIQAKEIYYPEWISVGDEIPEEGKKVLVSDGNQCVVASYNYNLSSIKNTDEIVWDYSDCCGCHKTGITHWMPIPKLSE